MRTHRIAIALVTTGLALGGTAASAQAEVVGAAAASGAAETCSTRAEVVGAASVSAPGTLTEFRYRSATDGFGSRSGGDLQVLRPRGGTSYEVIGSVAISDPESGALLSFPASIPVEAGDRLGIYSGNDRGASIGLGCVQSVAGPVEYAIEPSRPTVGTVVTVDSLDSRALNLEATVEATPPPVVPLLEGHGVSGIRTRFDFTVNGPETAPSGSATLTTADGGFIRSGAISCFRQVSSTKAIFGVVDTVSKAPATRYREFYVEDNGFGGNVDRLVELAKSSATAPPVSCKSATPKPGSGRLIRSGDISLGGVPA